MRKAKTILLFLCAFAMLTAAAAACVLFQRNRAADTVRFVVQAGDVREKVSLYDNSGTYYAFLPAYADFGSMQIEYEAGCVVYLDGKAYTNGMTCGELLPDRPYNVTITDAFGTAVSNRKLVVKKAANIPAMALHLSNGTLESLHANKEVSKTGTVSVIGADQSVLYAGAFKSIHGRGNSTWSQAKKSYALEFEADTELLGMGTGKNWVLLANPMDESGLRNKLVYDTAKSLGLKYAVDAEYIDLYVDGEYLGLYLLTERIETGANRVAITDLLEKTQAVNQSYLSNYPQVESLVNGRIRRGYDIPSDPSDITGGYLLQIEHHADRILNKSSLIQTRDLSFSLSSPQYASIAQLAYIADCMERIEEQLRSGDLSGIDVDSFVTLYLIQELFANTDHCSVFFYKDTDSVDGKLYAGPVWDFDLSMGNGWYAPDSSPVLLYRNRNNWFNYLDQNESFKQRLRDSYWNTLKPRLTELVYDRLDAYQRRMNASFLMNKLRWSNVSSYNNLDSLSQKRYDTLDEHVARITGFLEERMAFLDEIWAEESAYSLVSFTSHEFGLYYDSCYVKTGEGAGRLPDPQSEASVGHRFVGWFDANGNVYEPDQPITEQTAYTARWERLPDAENTHKIPAQSAENEQVIPKQAIGIAAICAAIVLFFGWDMLQAVKAKRCRHDTDS